MSLFDVIAKEFTKGLKALGRGVGSAIDVVGNYFGEEKISNFGKSLKNACSNINTGVQKVKSTENHKNESARYVSSVNDIFVKFYKDIKERAEDIENTCIKYTEEYFDNILDVLCKQGKEIETEFNFQKLRITRRRIKNVIKGFIQKEISQKISMDNAECTKIMQIKDDKLRGEKMQNYCLYVVDKAIVKLDNKVQDILKEQNAEIEKFLLDFQEKREFSLKNMEKQLLKMEKREKKLEKESWGDESLKQLKVIMYIDEITEELA